MGLEVGWDQRACTISQLVFSQAQLLYPFLLLVAYGVVFAVHSVYSSRHQEDVEAPSVTGPGGKPLPVTRKKAEASEIMDIAYHEFSPKSYNVFRLGNAAIVLTFFYHSGHLLVQCAQAGWVNMDKFYNDELLVSRTVPSPPPVLFKGEKKKGKIVIHSIKKTKDSRLTCVSVCGGRCFYWAECSSGAIWE